MAHAVPRYSPVGSNALVNPKSVVSSRRTPPVGGIGSGGAVGPLLTGCPRGAGRARGPVVTAPPVGAVGPLVTAPAPPHAAATSASTAAKATIATYFLTSP